MTDGSARPGDSFPPRFFERMDDAPDRVFYGPSRLVTHIDPNAIAAVGRFYTELNATGRVLDLMSSWISHLETAPAHLIALGMNAEELDANEMANHTAVHDLNAEPTMPFADDSFDTAVCTVSVDYLTRPVEVFADVARILGPGGLFACTFSNRCFPTKAIQGWLETDDRGRCALVAHYFTATGAFEPPQVEVLVPPDMGADPLYGVWATRS